MNDSSKYFSALSEGIRNDLDDWGAFCVMNQIDLAQREAYNKAIEDIQNDIQRFKKFEGEEGVLCISIDRINELKK